MLEKYEHRVGAGFRKRYNTKTINPFILDMKEIYYILSNKCNDKIPYRLTQFSSKFVYTFQENANIKNMLLANGYTDGISEVVEDIYRDDVFYKPAFRPILSMPSAAILQDFFDIFIPNASYRDYFFDPKIVETVPLGLHCDPFKFDRTMKLYSKNNYDKLKPVL